MSKNSFMYNRAFSNTLIAYLIGLHLVLAVLLFKTNFFEKVEEKLYGRPELPIHYYVMSEFYRRADETAPKGSVVFLGDSLTQGMSTSAVHPFGINYGIGNDTTIGLLGRLSNYKSLNRASLIVVQIGHNDFRYRAPKQIVENMARIFDTLPSHVPIIVTAIFPVDGNIVSEPKNGDIVAVNREIATLASKYSNIRFLNINKQLSSSGTVSLDTFLHIGDGVHLNKNGYQYWLMNLKALIKDIKADESY